MDRRTGTGVQPHLSLVPMSDWQSWLGQRAAGVSLGSEMLYLWAYKSLMHILSLAAHSKGLHVCVHYHIVVCKAFH